MIYFSKPICTVFCYYHLMYFKKWTHIAWNIIVSQYDYTERLLIKKSIAQFLEPDDANQPMT